MTWDPGPEDEKYSKSITLVEVQKPRSIENLANHELNRKLEAWTLFRN